MHSLGNLHGKPKVVWCAARCADVDGALLFLAAPAGIRFAVPILAHVPLGSLSSWRNYRRSHLRRERLLVLELRTPTQVVTTEPQKVINRQPERGQSILREVVRDVACVPLSIVNAYFVGAPDAGDRSWVLVDAGLAFSTGSIQQAAAARFGPDSRPAAIVLTHGHFDHVGTLPDLANAWDVPVYAHALEMPYLTGKSSYPPPDPAVGGGAMAFLSRLYPRGPIDLGNRVRALPANGSIPAMPGWRWVHTPGHTAGHVSLFRDIDRTLLAGDAFVTTKQESALSALLRLGPHVHRPPAYYTTDWDAARRSVEALAQLSPEVVATGHGLPMSGEEMRQQLEELARDWDRLARPAHGRYVREPAITDERGVVSVPPPVADPRLLIAGLGIAAAVLLLCQSPSMKSTRLENQGR
ncbi:MAG: MBL fold metallo-hydrolase [Gemmataceae bacterium]|nr:MBL fold metallo-hydrolase [Gemmataceae bacterium]